MPIERSCRNCEKRATMACPNSFLCFSRIDKPYFKAKPRPRTRLERFYRWNFIRRWRKVNKTWRECRHKRRSLNKALVKAGFWI